ncbi:MAG: Gfo/Idh/MocA family oxidoreductase [Acidimicrobiia bacterium]
MTVRVGIVGCGFIGTVHSFALAALVKAGLVDAVVTATCDVDAERAARLAEPHGARRCTEVTKLIDAVDAVWVCTWTVDHRAVVAAAVERGLAVFCEKPLAPTMAECEEVAVLLERVPHQVGLVLRHAPVFAAAAADISSGRHGRPLAVLMRDDQFFPIQGHYSSEWRSDVAKAGGGTLLEHSIHDVDVLAWILGAPVWVRAEVASRFGHAGIDDVAALTLGYDDGSHATLLSVWHQVLSRTSNRRLEVFCEDGFLWADDDYLGPLHVETSAGTSVIQGELPDWASRLDVPVEFLAPIAQYAQPTKAFLDAVATGGSTATGWPDASTALAAHRIVDAAYRSAAAGGAVNRIGG